MISNNESLRYERKLIVNPNHFFSFRTLNNLYNLGLSEIHKSRRINSIYYDTNQFILAKQHLDGFKDRLKCRVRFYGDIQKIDFPILEFKMKKSYVGNKYKIKLTNDELSKSKFKLNFIKENNFKIPSLIKDKMSFLNPKLFVTYLREYYMSKCLNYRFTFDKNIQFYLIENSFSNMNDILNLNPFEFENNIIEIKYQSNFDQGASEFLNKLPFRLTDCSKYILGLKRFGIVE